MRQTEILKAAIIYAIALWAHSNAHAADVEPFLKFAHTSDVLTGFPFENHAGKEPTTDYLGVGATITIGARKRFELDLSHGRKARDCDARFGCGTESGSEISVRWYPMRGKQKRD